jgi:hypothetical protein
MLSEDERDVLSMHAAAAKVRHLTPAQLSQVNYELQRKGLVADAGCCGRIDLTEAAIELLWEEYRSAAVTP